jgi:hypothetical protein
MRFICLSGIFLFVVISAAIAQLVPDTLSMVKYRGHYNYKFGEKEVRFVDLYKITATSPTAHKYMKYARNNNTFANILLGSGIIGFGFACLVNLDSGDSEKIKNGIISGAIVGGSMALVSIPLRMGKNKNARKGVKAYNIRAKKMSGYYLK